MTCSEAWDKVKEAVDQGDFEDTLVALARWLDLDREREPDVNARSCLESAAAHCRDAAMDYYVSMK